MKKEEGERQGEEGRGRERKGEEGRGRGEEGRGSGEEEGGRERKGEEGVRVCVLFAMKNSGNSNRLLRSIPRHFQRTGSRLFMGPLWG